MAYKARKRKVKKNVPEGIAYIRDTALRSLISGGLEITSLSDVTPIPHNGCRPPKRPRG